LFDEPLSNLDAKLRVQMRTEIKGAHQKVRTTTVYVTHGHVEAMTPADRVAVMRANLHQSSPLRSSLSALVPPLPAVIRFRVSTNPCRPVELR
jgi:ABC-type sugar transport system ATPase subunit